MLPTFEAEGVEMRFACSSSDLVRQPVGREAAAAVPSTLLLPQHPFLPMREAF
ncbi:MAG: hypothetical protein R2839_07535 [Thermomicrobiales bacterium]